MSNRISRLVVPALLAATIPAAIVVAQTQSPATPQPQADAPRADARPGRPSPEALARLQDGRMAMIKEALKLNDAQLKLWEPVETHLRSSFEERRKLGEERRQARRERTGPLPFPDRLERASQRMAQRAERMKAFAQVVRPFYDSLNDEQKTVARLLLRDMRSGHRFAWAGRRWSMERERGDHHHGPQQ